MSGRHRNAYAAPAWAAEQKVGDVGTKATLLVLANYADEEFSGYPSQATIARETEQGERTVRRQLALLEELGLIKRVKRGASDGGRSSDRFYLQLDTVVTDPSAAREKVAQPDPQEEGQEGYRPDWPERVSGQERPVSGGGYRPNQGGLPATGGRGTPRTPITTPPTPSSSSDPLPGMEGTTADAVAERSEEEDWEQWWRMYPRKVGRAAARQAWTKAVAKVPANLLITTLQATLPAWAQREERFIPHASTWLNGERWDDPIPQPAVHEYNPWDDNPHVDDVVAQRGY